MILGSTITIHSLEDLFQVMISKDSYCFEWVCKKTLLATDVVNNVIDLNTIPPCMEAMVTHHTGFVALLKSVSVTVTQGWLLVSHSNFLLSMP